MNTQPDYRPGRPTAAAPARHPGTTGRTTFTLLVAVTAALGVAALVSWVYHRPPPKPETAPETESGGLSPATLAALRQLHEPVSVRLYALLGGEPTNSPLVALGGRAESLLNAYAGSSAGKLSLTRLDSTASNAVATASADGIKVFNLESGDGNALGVVMACGKRTEVLPRLAPEWEGALESDLTRALLRVIAPAAPAVGGAAEPKAAALQEVRSLLPDLDSNSLEANRQALQSKAREALATVIQEMEARLEPVRQKLADAQSRKAESERQAALKELRALQAEQSAKVKEIAARLETQTKALEQLKKN